MLSWGFIRLAALVAMLAHIGAYSLKKTSWYRNIIVLLGVEDHPFYLVFWKFGAHAASA